MGIEPTNPEGHGLASRRINHSATVPGLFLPPSFVTYHPNPTQEIVLSSYRLDIGVLDRFFHLQLTRHPLALLCSFYLYCALLIYCVIYILSVLYVFMKKERNINAYSSDGRIYQLEYAMKAASLGTTTIGFKVADGVVIASEKKIVSSLQISESIRKHHLVYKHCGFSFSGLSGDARTIIKKARNISLDHNLIYNENVPIEGVVKALSAISLNFGEKEESKKIFSRPFGIAMLICGYDIHPRLFSLDASGTYTEYRAKAMGSAAEAVTPEIEKAYKSDMSIEETISTILSLLKAVMKDPLTKNNCEVMVSTSQGITFIHSDEIEQYLQRIKE
ncbi:20S proteasome subunit alpha 5 [Nematocida sp. LUAm3]|nr:20S proteasome subunit alpha 5 [Nematocida sp. LUAm3]KAI5173745.1 20S proteasome subunit alpha 5 [Nematocida sp. LUAm2]KAI5176968.1 20S proteasome subunit alpha 5 [Nematocida sp. LUAm1]